MPLITYASAAVGGSDQRRSLARRMPPWPAERGFGTFSNDIGLTPREFEFLISWVDGGVPEGRPATARFVDHGAHWMLGTPDLVLTPKVWRDHRSRQCPRLQANHHRHRADARDLGARIRLQAR